MSSAQPPNPPPYNDEKSQKAILLKVQHPWQVLPPWTQLRMPSPLEENWDDIPEEVLSLNTEEIQMQGRLIDNDIKVSENVCRPDALIQLSLGYEVGNLAVTA